MTRINLSPLLVKIANTAFILSQSSGTFSLLQLPKIMAGGSTNACSGPRSFLKSSTRPLLLANPGPGSGSLLPRACVCLCSLLQSLSGASVGANSHDSWSGSCQREGRQGTLRAREGKRERGRWKKRGSGREEGNRVRDTIRMKEAREGRREEGNMRNSNNNKYFLSLTAFFSCV